MSTAALVLALVVGDHTAADVRADPVPARRRPGVDRRLLPRLQDLRPADARRPHPEEVCAECADISGRLRSAATANRSPAQPSYRSPRARANRSRCPAERGTAQDVVLGDLDPVQAEQPQHLDRRSARRRRSWARGRGASPATSRRSCSGMRRGAPGSARTRLRRARSRGPARGRRDRAAGAIAASEVAVPATAMARLTRLGAARRAPRRSGSRVTSSRQLLELVGLGRVVVQVALGLAHDPGLGGDVEHDLGALPDDQLGRAAADVDHERRRSVVGVAFAGGAAERRAAPPRRRTGRGARARSGCAQCRRTPGRWRSRARRWSGPPGRGRSRGDRSRPCSRRASRRRAAWRPRAAARQRRRRRRAG